MTYSQAYMVTIYDEKDNVIDFIFTGNKDERDDLLKKYGNPPLKYNANGEPKTYTEKINCYARPYHVETLKKGK